MIKLRIMQYKWVYSLLSRCFLSDYCKILSYAPTGEKYCSNTLGNHQSRITLRFLPAWCLGTLTANRSLSQQCMLLTASLVSALFQIDGDGELWRALLSFSLEWLALDIPNLHFDSSLRFLLWDMLLSFLFKFFFLVDQQFRIVVKSMGFSARKN